MEWNFQKFLVNRHGKVIARFKPGVDPLDKKCVSAVEKALEEKASAKKDAKGK